MTTNGPQEPDEFQTRMRKPASEGDVEDTNRSGAVPTQPPGQQPGQQPPQGQPGQPPFAPPGFGGASQPQPPAGYGAPQPTPSAQPQQSPPFGQQPTQSFGQQPTQSFGQQSQAPQPWGQPAQQAPQPAGGYGQQQPGYPQGGFAQQSQQAGWGGIPQKPQDASPLKAAFDFSFGTYATPGIVKIVYVVGIVLATLSYVLSVIAAFAAGAGRDYGYGIETSGTILPGLLALLFGWIPVAFFILVLRLALEQVLASVRTATDARVLRERSDDQASQKGE